MKLQLTYADFDIKNSFSEAFGNKTPGSQP